MWYNNTLAYAIQENVFGKPLVVKFVNQFIGTNSEADYNLSVEALNASVVLCNDYAKELKVTSRILATLPDGSVWYDSSKGDKNTFANYKSKTMSIISIHWRNWKGNNSLLE